MICDLDCGHVEGSIAEDEDMVIQVGQSTSAVFAELSVSTRLVLR